MLKLVFLAHVACGFRGNFQVRPATVKHHRIVGLFVEKEESYFSALDGLDGSSVIIFHILAIVNRLTLNCRNFNSKG